MRKVLLNFGLMIIASLGLQSIANADDGAVLNSLIFPEQNPGLSIAQSGKVVFGGGWTTRKIDSDQATLYSLGDQGPRLSMAQEKDGQSSVLYFGNSEGNNELGNRLMRAIQFKNNNLSSVANCSYNPQLSGAFGAFGTASCISIDNKICQQFYSLADVRSATELEKAQTMCDKIDSALKNPDFLKSVQQSTNQQIPKIQAMVAHMLPKDSVGQQRSGKFTVRADEKSISAYNRNAFASICKAFDASTAKSTDTNEKDVKTTR